MLEEKIINLWRWFYTHEKLIRDSVQNELKEEQERIVQNLDNLMLDLGRFSWHIEMGEMKDWAFIVSPNEDEQLLQETKEIISLAPDLENWEFHYCKQRKVWERKLSLYDIEYEIVEIDASNWMFTLTTNDAGKFDLLFKADNTVHVDEETCITAANMVVLNEIGEEKKILNIDSVNFADKTEEAFGDWVQISQLQKMIS